MFDSTFSSWPSQQSNSPAASAFLQPSWRGLLHQPGPLQNHESSPLKSKMFPPLKNIRLCLCRGMQPQCQTHCDQSNPFPGFFHTSLQVLAPFSRPSWGRPDDGWMCWSWLEHKIATVMIWIWKPLSQTWQNLKSNQQVLANKTLRELLGYECLVNTFGCCMYPPHFGIALWNGRHFLVSADWISPMRLCV